MSELIVVEWLAFGRMLLLKWLLLGAVIAVHTHDNLSLLIKSLRCLVFGWDACGLAWLVSPCEYNLLEQLLCSYIMYKSTGIQKVRTCGTGCCIYQPAGFLVRYFIGISLMEANEIYIQIYYMNMDLKFHGGLLSYCHPLSQVFFLGPKHLFGLPVLSERPWM